MSTILIGIAILVAVAAALFLAIGRERSWALLAGDPDLGHFDRVTPERSPRPNDALLCTPGLCEGVRVDAPLPGYAIQPARLIERIDAAMGALGVPVRRVDDGSDPNRARYVTFSPAMRFPDTNSFEAVPLPDGGTGLVAYARAQLGRSDLGKNRARLETVTARLAD